MDTSLDIKPCLINEYDGNKYYVNYNANPNKMRTSDCAIRSLACATGLEYSFILKCIREMNVQDYEVDDQGNSVPWGQFGYGKGEGYGVPALEVLQHRKLRPLVERVYDFSGTDMDLLEFTAFMSRNRPFRGRNMVALVESPAVGESIEDKWNKLRQHEQNIKRLEKAVEKSEFRLSDYKKINIDHAVCVKNGKYYDIWDSGRCLIKVVVVFRSADDMVKRPRDDRFFSIGSNSDSDYMLDRVGQSIRAKNIRKGEHYPDEDFDKAHAKLYSRRKTGVDGIRALFKKNRIPVSDRQFLKNVWLVRADGSEPVFEYDMQKFGKWPGSSEYYQFDYADGSVGDLNLYKLLKVCGDSAEFPDSHTYETLKTVYSESDIDRVFCFDVVQNDKPKYLWRLKFDNVLTYKLRRKFTREFFVFRFEKMTLDNV